MSSLTKVRHVSLTEATKIEEIRLFITNAIDDLEQTARARELTSLIWDVNTNQNETEHNWRKTEILLESYEKQRDESLESALLTLKELAEMIDEDNLERVSSSDVGVNINIDVQTVNI